MNIIHVNYDWQSNPITRSKTDWIILHHTATTTATVGGIHNHHKNNNGWIGFGYHAFVDKNGYVYSGRPFNTQGAHCLGYNNNSIGVCFAGNFEIEQMTQEQVKKGIELLKYLKKMYPEAKITRHKDLNNTSCPGKNFIDDIIVKALEPEIIIDPLADKKERLLNLREPIEHDKLMDRLLQIYDNAEKIDKEHRILVRQLFKK